MGKTPLYSAVKVSLRVAREEILKCMLNMYIFNSFYLPDSYSEGFL